MTQWLVELARAFNPNGLRIAGVVVLGGLLLIVLVDLYLEKTGQAPLGYWVTGWARRYPLYPILLVLIYGMLLAHLYWSTPG